MALVKIFELYIFQNNIYNMCGIVGFIGNDNAYEKILNGLIQLQNRGYDSAGISVMEDDIKTWKYASVESATALEKLSKFGSESSIGIGHTRWATHGAKTDVNSHPHVSYNNIFSLVHNGIIENYKELKAMLVKRGIQNKSQTDTEVIVNLIAMFYDENKDVFTSIQKTTKLLKGTWGICVLCKNEPNKIYCTRHGSPLLIGIDDSMMMITSEQSGFCNMFNQYIVLNNHDICVLDYNESNTVELKTNDNYEQHEVNNNEYALTPDPYPHWTLKEINEQVESSQRAISMGGRLLENSVRLGGLNKNEKQVGQIDNLIILGCGTSYHSGMYGAFYFKEMSELNNIQLFDGAEFTKEDIPKLGNTALILISQSGETKDLHRCIQIANDCDLFTIGIVNVVDSLIAREVNCGCYLNAGREVAVASTKAYTSQVILLNMIALWFAQYKNIHNTKRQTMIKDLRKLYLDIQKTIQISMESIKPLLSLFENKSSCFILGKGKGESVAREGALKIKEISYIHAEGYSTSSLKHGPFALLEPGFPVILVAPNDEHYAKSMNAYEEIKSRHAEIVVITDNKDCDLPNTIIIPYNETFRHLLSVIPMQLLAYELSLMNGLNPDMPRNLAKVVTVE
jgi:glucosamine--fructose-6-phosphate aminotransferase (isomerizing)